MSVKELSEGFGIQEVLSRGTFADESLNHSILTATTTEELSSSFTGRHQSKSSPCSISSEITDATTASNPLAHSDGPQNERPQSSPGKMMNPPPPTFHFHSNQHSMDSHTDSLNLERKVSRPLPIPPCSQNVQHASENSLKLLNVKAAEFVPGHPVNPQSQNSVFSGRSFTSIDHVFDTPEHDIRIKGLKDGDPLPSPSDTRIRSFKFPSPRDSHPSTFSLDFGDGQTGDAEEEGKTSKTSTDMSVSMLSSNSNEHPPPPIDEAASEISSHDRMSQWANLSTLLDKKLSGLRTDLTGFAEMMSDIDSVKRDALLDALVVRLQRTRVLQPIAAAPDLAVESSTRMEESLQIFNESLSTLSENWDTKLLEVAHQLEGQGLGFEQHFENTSLEISKIRQKVEQHLESAPVQAAENTSEARVAELIEKNLTAFRVLLTDTVREAVEQRETKLEQVLENYSPTHIIDKIDNLNSSILNLSERLTKSEESSEQMYIKVQEKSDFIKRQVGSSNQMHVV